MTSQIVQEWIARALSDSAHHVAPEHLAAG